MKEKYTLGFIIITIIVAFFMPIIAWLSGLLIGWIIKLIIGQTFISYVNLLLGSSFTTDTIPGIFGVLCIVASLFKNTGGVSVAKN